MDTSIRDIDDHVQFNESIAGANADYTPFISKVDEDNQIFKEETFVSPIANRQQQQSKKPFDYDPLANKKDKKFSSIETRSKTKGDKENLDSIKTNLYEAQLKHIALSPSRNMRN